MIGTTVQPYRIVNPPGKCPVRRAPGARRGRRAIRTCLALLLLASAAHAADATLDGQTLLGRILDHHDPRGDFMEGTFALELRTEYADGRSRVRSCEVDYATASYRDRYEQDGHTVETSVSGEDCTLRVDGSTDIGPELAASLNLSCERARLFRNYVSYLWGLPMKLRDPGTIIEPEVERGEFQGRDVLILTVRYEAGVGTDTWFFYALPDSHAMIGYAFEKADGKGEYITLEGTLELDGGYRIPRTRRWYMTADDAFLGTDVLLSAERLR